MPDSVLFSSKSEEWSTPQELFNFLDSIYHFTLDPCASDFNHKCDNYFTKKNDGLLKSWKGHSVFCNPPYGRNLYTWVKKCALEASDPDTSVVLLIPSRTDTAYFHDYILPLADIIFLRGRLHFNDSKNPAPFPSLIAIFH